MAQIKLDIQNRIIIIFSTFSINDLKCCIIYYWKIILRLLLTKLNWYKLNRVEILKAN